MTWRVSADGRSFGSLVSGAAMTRILSPRRPADRCRNTRLVRAAEQRLPGWSCPGRVAPITQPCGHRRRSNGNRSGAGRPAPDDHPGSGLQHRRSL
jgi:hypothetical protein